MMKNSFDSSKKPGRGPFATKIGVGRLIQGMFIFLSLFFFFFEWTFGERLCCLLMSMFVVVYVYRVC